MIGGGQQNSLQGGVSNVILGMVGNKIINGQDNIIAGTTTTVTNLSGVFVWSDSSFAPQQSNTFYVNAKN